MPKITSKQLERGIYILVIILLLIFGIWNIETAVTLIKAFSEAMQIIITTSPAFISL